MSKKDWNNLHGTKLHSKKLNKDDSDFRLKIKVELVLNKNKN